MSKFNNAQVLINWTSGLIDGDTNEAILELRGQIKAFIRGEVADRDVGELCRRLMSLAPQFDGKLFQGANLASTMRCAARELRHATAVSA
jgi:hypothetical protein